MRKLSDSTALGTVATVDTTAAVTALAALLLAVSGCDRGASDPPRETGIPDDAVRGTVRYVVDGDTLQAVVGGERERVRLLLIDTPESAIPDVEPQCLGVEAAERLRELVEGTDVWLAYDVERFDQYGRELMYVWDDDGRFVNELLVAEGYARVEAYEPNVRYLELVEDAQRQAMADRVGIWDPEVCPAGG